jgi:hypothetical protein
MLMTYENLHKESTITKDESNMYPITVPAMSVVTYVGSVQ